MNIDKKTIENYLAKWQMILRLQDWDVKVQIVETTWRKSADIKINENLRIAILLINKNPVCQNLEDLVLHELLHLKLWPMDQMIESLLIGTFGNNDDDPKYNFAYGQFMNVLESTVADLTKSFLGQNGDQTEINFDAVEKLVNEEIKTFM